MTGETQTVKTSITWGPSVNPIVQAIEYFYNQRKKN